LLSRLATAGQGVFGFIPDSTMVGTIFINALSNSLLCDKEKTGWEEQGGLNIQVHILNL
jgi:hypothetical protein